MRNAYIVKHAEDETPEQVEFRLRDALKAVAGEREYPVVDSTYYGRGGIAGFNCNIRGKAIVVSEEEAEQLAHSIAQTMGRRCWREVGFFSYDFDGKNPWQEGRNIPSIFCLSREPNFVADGP